VAVLCQKAVGKFRSSTLDQEFMPWPMQGQVLMVLNILICTTRTSHHKGEHVVCGKVVQGYEVVKEIEAVGSSVGEGQMSKAVVIGGCRELPLGECSAAT